MADLIDTTRAKQFLTSATSADDTIIGVLITAATKAICKWCRRDFTSQAYDEIYDARRDARLILRQYPLVSLQAVKTDPVPVLTVQNTLTTNQIARASVTSSGITLVRVASGVVTTVTSVTFAGNVTVTAVATAITAIGTGWTATADPSYLLWPSADLMAIQGGLNAAYPASCQFVMHTTEIADFEVNAVSGWIRRTGGWPTDTRVKYTAGYATIPEDVQEACAELVGTMFRQLDRSLNLDSEDTVGAYAITAENSLGQLPQRIRTLLNNYRRVNVMAL